MSSRHTINLNGAAYCKLKKFGTFGETYSELIVRLLEIATVSSEGEKKDK
jgi:predicted CopG family antitoxin